MTRYDHARTAMNPGGGSVPALCRYRATGAALLALALAMPGMAAATASTVPESARPEAVATAPAESQTEAVQSAEERLGVHVKGVRLSAGGFMLDFRYRVLDGAKAAPLLDRKLTPYLLAGDGARLGVPASPKIGPLRSTQRGVIRPDRDYTILFGNPGGYLRPGSKISLIVGEHKIENLTVE